MGTLTHNPAQSNFYEDFTLNFPAGHKPEIGSVVGPNWCNEFYVVNGFEQVTIGDRSFVRAFVQELTEDRKELLTIENRRDFVALATSAKAYEMATDFRRAPEPNELRQLEAAFRNENVIDAVVRLLEQKRAARER